MMGLTPKQAQALGVIKRLSCEGVRPSYVEIGEEIGVSAGGVHRLLRGLQVRGYVEFTPHLARSVRILGELEGLERRSDADLRALRDRITFILNKRAS